MRWGDPWRRALPECPDEEHPGFTCSPGGVFCVACGVRTEVTVAEYLLEFEIESAFQAAIRAERGAS